MKKRIIIEITVGGILTVLFFYWLYLRPRDRTPVMLPEDPAIKKSMAENREKVLVIGVDGMTWEVAMDLVNRGGMPHLARLLLRGTHGIMRSTPPLISPALWTTMATGQPREIHGIDNFTAKVPFQYREAVMTSRYRRVPALWQMMSWAKKSVGVVNWYSTYPAEEVFQGVFVAEGMVPGRDDAALVYPPSWREKLETATLAGYEPYEQALERIADPRVEKAYNQDLMAAGAALRIMRETGPDLMLVYLQNLDVVSHGFWKYRWPVGLNYRHQVSKKERERYGDVVEMHYRFTDYLIGALVGEAPEYTVIVVSDHGLGATYAPHNIFPDLNNLLFQLGYLEYQGPTCEKVLEDLAVTGALDASGPERVNLSELCRDLERQTLKAMEQGAGMMEPAAVEGYLSAKAGLSPAGDPEKEKKREETFSLLARTLVPRQQRQDILWKKTKVWNASDFHKRVQGLYLNLAGREPEGAVPEEDYEGFRQKVIYALRKLRTERGDPLFRMVRKNPDKEVIPDTVADPPDILVEVSQEALVQEYAFRGDDDPFPVPLASIRWTYQDVSADHTPEGVFVLSGSRARTFKKVDLRPLDLAPTILWIMGLPVGADMPGQVLVEAFDEPLSSGEPLYIESWSRVIKEGVESEPVEISPDQMERFKALGYIK